MKLHERLKKYRIKNGLKQKFVEERAGLPAKRLSAIEKGTVKLTGDEFETICINGLKVNPSIFFTNEFLETKNNTTGEDQQAATLSRTG